jgi:heavy metal translocating P-type ATPase
MREPIPSTYVFSLTPGSRFLAPSMSTCTHCGGPITGGGHAGRGDAVYCCFGCLDLGEAACASGGCCSSSVASTKGKFDGTAIRLGIGILVVGQSMIFGLALNLHDDVPHAVRNFTQWLILAGTVLVAALLGGPLVRVAWGELRRGRLTIEALFLLTMAGALVASLQAHLTGRGKIYFEVVSVLLVVYTLGRLIGARSRAAALARSRAWGEELCTCRLVDAAGHTRTAPVTDVLPGDVVEVHPGELIAVDGVIREGVGFVSESVVSGEPFVVVRRPGDRVLAGSATFDATFRITANAKGTERQVDRLLAAVEEARDKPLSLQSRADRLGRWFLPLVVITALGTFTYWTFLTDAGWEVGLFNAMSVLLVACPCVIGLATPIVIWSALGRLAERGAIVRSGDAIERLAAVDLVLFDKTGTLTEDRFALVDIETTATGAERAKLLGWLSLVQAQSHHPVAKPFAELPRPFAPGEEPRVLSLVAVPGCGVFAELEEVDGSRHEIRIGTPEWLRFDRVSQTPGGEGKTVHVVLDGELAAVATVAERLRVSAPEALAHFARLGLPVEVLTGDAAGRAEALGLPLTRAELLPDDKRAAIEAAKVDGAKPLFVGDGINDVAALAAAHVGVALSSGTDLAVSAAAVTLYHDDLRALPWAVELSRAAVRAVRRNLFRALAYNLVGMTLAACGVLHPVVAAILMVVSSLTLIFSSTRVGCAKEPNPPSPFPKREGGERARSLLGASQSLSALATSHPSLDVHGSLNPAPPPSPRGKGAGGLGSALVHALAFALQGGVFLLLLASLREPLLAVALTASFALVGAALAIAWHRLSVPHSLDMCFGMLTLGNLGMLVGWWADNGFAALHDHGCCACVEAMRDGVMKPWMWLGMLAFANIAMRWFGRSPVPRGCHALAMWTGGNAGMVLGMLAGGWVAAQFETTSVTAAVAASFAGMTVGMLAGMLAGTWFAERLLGGLRAVGFAPRWLRVTSRRTS